METKKIRTNHTKLLLLIKYIFFFLCFLFVSLLVHKDILLSFSYSVTSFYGDTPIFLWNMWWMKKALLELFTNPFWTDYIIYPVQVNLAWHTFVPFLSLLSVPFQLFLPLVTVYNLFSIITLTLNGFSLFWVSNKITKNIYSSFLAGLYFMLCPYLILHGQGHFNLFNVWPLPLVLYFGYKTFSLVYFDKKIKINYFIFAVFLTSLSAYIDLYYFLYSMLFILLLCLIFIVDKHISFKKESIQDTFTLSFSKTTEIKKLILLLLAFTFFVFVMIFPYIYYYFKEGFKLISDYNTIPLDHLSFYSPHLYSFFTAPSSSFWIKKVFTSLDVRFNNEVFLGYIWFLVILLLIINRNFQGLWKKLDFRKYLVIGAVTFLVLSFGPVLKISEKISLTLPTIIFHTSIIGKIFHTPIRWIILFYLLGAFILSYIFRFFLKKNKNFFGLFLIIILLDFFAVFEANTVEVPKAYSQIIKSTEDVTLLEFPFSMGTGLQSRGAKRNDITFQYYQTIHQKKIWGGHVSRLIPEKMQFYDQIDFIKHFEKTPFDIKLNTKEQNSIIRMIQEYKLGYIMLNKPVWENFLTNNSQVNNSLENTYLSTGKKLIETYFPVKNVFEDETYILYKIM